MVRQARLCVVESAREAYGMDEAEFHLMESLAPLDLCDCCGGPCEIRSDTLISVCDTCRAEIQEEQNVINECHERLRQQMREDDEYGWRYSY